MTDLDALDVRLHPPHAEKRMPYGECVRWIMELKADVAQLKSGEKSHKRMIAIITGLVEKKEGTHALAIAFLQEQGIVPIPKAPAPPVDQQRKEFMDFYKKANPKVRAELEKSVKDSNDPTLMAEIEKEKA